MWYTACLLYKGTHITHVENPPLWEQSILLFQATSKLEAEEKAKNIGKSEEHEYFVEDGPSEDLKGILRWTFEWVKVVDVGDEVKDGVEVFSTFLRNEAIDSFLKPFKEQ